MLGRNLTKTDRTKRDASGRCRYRRCTNAGQRITEADDEAEEDIVSNAKYVVPKVVQNRATRPVAYDWLVPDKHGTLRSVISSPASPVSPPVQPVNHIRRALLVPAVVAQSPLSRFLTKQLHFRC